MTVGCLLGCTPGITHTGQGVIKLCKSGLSQRVGSPGAACVLHLLVFFKCNAADLNWGPCMQCASSNGTPC